MKIRKKLDIENPFSLFHFETYLDIEDYKKVRKQLDDYKKTGKVKGLETGSFFII